MGRRWRTWLGVVAGALAALVLVYAIAFYSRTAEPPPAIAAYPRIQQAAGIIDLMRELDPKLRPAALRSLNGVDLQAEIVSQPPAPAPSFVRAPRVEGKLKEFAAPGIPGELTAYVNGNFPLRKFDTEGLPTRITWSSAGGETLVLNYLERARPAPRFTNLPTGLWLGLAGLAVAALSLILSYRETQAVLRVTAAAETFDGSPTRALVEQASAPEMRKLANAVSDMQQRVAVLLQERSFLIGAISHDLKTYLTRVRLRAEGLPDPAQRERMTNDLESMTDLIDTSLAFARGTTVSQHKRLVDLADLAAIEAAERAALKQPVTLAGDTTIDALVLGDPVALRRVLSNLVDNALKFGGGKVEIVLEADAQNYQLFVDDDGPGVSEAERAAIFSPFYRIEGSRNLRTGGSGLGLAIARQIVEAHGGALNVAQSPLGGARFGVSVPKQT